LAENRYFSYPLLGGLRRNIAISFVTEKLEWFGYSMMKMFDNVMFSVFDRIPTCDRQTDRQTDGRTDILR